MPGNHADNWNGGGEAAADVGVFVHVVNLEWLATDGGRRNVVVIATDQNGAASVFVSFPKFSAGFKIAGLFHDHQKLSHFQKQRDTESDDGRDQEPEVEFDFAKFYGVFGITKFGESRDSDDGNVERYEKQR